MKPVQLGNASIHIASDFNVVLDLKGELKKPLCLTKTEARILRAFFDRPGIVCTPRMLASELYPGKNARSLPEQGIIKVMICKLRKKLTESGLPDPIENVWGRGYRFGEVKSPVLSDLIPDELQKPARWYVHRKEKVLGLITDLETQQSVLAFFSDLSADELYEWRNLYQEHGRIAMRATKAWRAI